MRAKKSLGQNFFKNEKLLEKIIEKSEIPEKSIVLEIGPGKGALTKILFKNNFKVFAVEKDKRMISFLEEKFEKEIKDKKFFLFEDDVLKIDFEKMGLKNEKFYLVANLPYYISSRFLRVVFEGKILPKKMTLVLQKEVALRIAEKKKRAPSARAQKALTKKIKEKSSLLSLSVKAYGDPKFLLPISRKNFSPIPRVDSAAICIENISKNFFKKNKISEDEFFNFLKICFSGKRKTLLKNLSAKYKKEKILEVFNFLKINLKERAEDLELKDFLEIKKNLN